LKVRICYTRYVAKAKLYSSAFPRFFAMARHASWNGGIGGWFVCDALDADRQRLARPVAHEPCEDRAEALAIAEMLNDENNSWGDRGPQQWS
jgi:hypothetical protein